MKKLLIGFVLLFSQINLMAQKQEDYIQYVNPLIGTEKMGHTFPGATVPFGSVQLSPDTDEQPHNIGGKYNKDTYKYCAGYNYDDTTIFGFSHIRVMSTLPMRPPCSATRRPLPIFWKIMGVWLRPNPVRNEPCGWRVLRLPYANPSARRCRRQNRRALTE